jgi:hypothetical protein
VSTLGETSVDHYLRVRDFFVKRDFPALLSYPFARNFPLIQALRFSACFLEQKPHPYPDLSVGDLSLGLQCQLALLWALLAKDTGQERYQKAANQLAGAIAPLVMGGLTTFGTREEDFSLEETKASVGLFLEALGHSSPKENLEGFFLELQNAQLRLFPDEPLAKPYELLEGEDAVMAYTLQGNRVSLGAARMGALQILAFGLQGEPCTEQKLFGADIHSKGYVNASAFKKIWVQTEFTLSGPQEFSLSMQAVGMESETPLYLVFYVKARSCQINNQIYKPKSLGKFRGEAQRVRFLGDAFFETAHPSAVELVPLAGEGLFWGASFLLAFRFPLSGKINLRIAK